MWTQSFLRIAEGKQGNGINEQINLGVGATEVATDELNRDFRRSYHPLRYLDPSAGRFSAPAEQARAIKNLSRPA